MKKNCFSILCCKKIFSFDLVDLNQGGKNFKCPCGITYWIPQKGFQSHHKNNPHDYKDCNETEN